MSEITTFSQDGKSSPELLRVAGVGFPGNSAHVEGSHVTTSRCLSISTKTTEIEFSPNHLVHQHRTSLKQPLAHTQTHPAKITSLDGEVQSKKQRGEGQGKQTRQVRFCVNALSRKSNKHKTRCEYRHRLEHRAGPNSCPTGAAACCVCCVLGL